MGVSNNINIKQIHHYTSDLNYLQSPNLIKEDSSLFTNESINLLFPSANNYDSEETAKEKANLHFYI